MTQDLSSLGLIKKALEDAEKLIARVQPAQDLLRVHQREYGVQVNELAAAGRASSQQVETLLVAYADLMRVANEMSKALVAASLEASGESGKLLTAYKKAANK